MNGDQEKSSNVEIAVLAKDVQLHGKLIHELTTQVRDIQSYQTELGLIVKMYMEQLKSFDIKLDNSVKTFEQKLNELMTLIHKVIHPDENKIKEQIHQSDTIVQFSKRIEILEEFQGRTESWLNILIAKASIFTHIGRNIKTYFCILVFIGFIAYLLLPDELKALFKWTSANNG